MASEQVRAVMALYPRIFFACHTRHVRDEGSNRTISAHQAGILDHLDEIEPTSVLDLARHTGVTASTMSITVDRLVRGGYVLRGRDARDARRVHLRLTQAGLRIKTDKTVLDAELVGALLRKLRPGERRAGIEGLALLARAASELVESREFKTMARKTS